LEEQLESLTARQNVLTKQRQELSYSASTGDKTSKQKLHANNAETGGIVNEIQIITDALAEARSRLNSSNVAGAKAQDVPTALKIQELQQAFIERLEAIDECCEDIAKMTTENKVLLSEMHRLGITHPSHDQARINSVLGA
jgi:chromosome segregation ATPase